LLNIFFRLLRCNIGRNYGRRGMKVKREEIILKIRGGI